MDLRSDPTWEEYKSETGAREADISTLPNEVLQEILLNVPYTELRRICRTSKRIQEVCEDEAFLKVYARKWEVPKSGYTRWADALRDWYYPIWEFYSVPREELLNRNIYQLRRNLTGQVLWGDDDTREEMEWLFGPGEPVGNGAQIRWILSHTRANGRFWDVVLNPGPVEDRYHIDIYGPLFPPGLSQSGWQFQKYVMDNPGIQRDYKRLQLILLDALSLVPGMRVVT